jgi:tetratricopeptide (TPR) repeat protein
MLCYNSNNAFKNISLLIILFIGGLNTHSQSVDSAFKFFDAGRYEQASQEFEKVLPLIEKEFGANDTSYYSFLLFYTGVSFERYHQYDKAEQYYLKAKTIYEKINALSNIAYITSLNRLAELYLVMGRFENAETLYKQALEINIKVYGEESLNYINALNNIARLYMGMGNYKKAEPYYLQALETSKRLFGTSHPRNAVLLNNIATLYHKMGNYEKAEPMYLEALEISKDISGEEDSNSVSLLNNLGAFYDDMGNYEKAESIYLKTLEIRKKIPGIEHPDYAISANNLAQLYFKMGNYEMAEPLYQQALFINKKVYGEEHVSYASLLNNLGALYHNKGNYEKAELLYLEALKIKKKVLGEKHPDYATTLNNIALFYHEIGNYEKAEPLYKQASEIRRETLGEGHHQYMITLNTMALFYFDTGNNVKAEKMLQQALEICKNTFGEDHPDYAVSLNNLALFYYNMGSYSGAETFYLQSLKISKRVLGEMHPVYATTLNNLAEVYDAMGRYEEAEVLYLQALDIIRQVNGEKHPDYATTLSNLAVLYQEGGHYEKAEPIYQQAMDTYLSQIKQQFSFLSESEKEKYLAKVIFFFMTYQNFILTQQKNKPSVAGKSYDIELYTKGLLLNADKQLRMFILNSRDSSALATYNSYLAVKASLAKQYSKPLAQQTLDIETIEAQANELEKQLSRLYSVKNNLNELQNVHWQDVQNQLKSNEAAIEFSHFPYYNGKRWTDSIMYVAILLKSDDIYPRIIPLFEEKQLETILRRAGGSDLNFINDLYRWAGKDYRSGSGKGQQIYHLVWKPLEEYLDSTQTVYYSPSGCMHQLSFSAIPCGETELLSDRYNLQLLSSSVQVTISHQERQVKKIVLYGGIDYDAGLDKMQGVADQYKKSGEKLPVQASRSLSQRNIRSGSLIYLDGTMSEVEKIRKLAEDNGINGIVLAGYEAIEESVKNLSGNSSPDIIHIATHGFFFPAADKNSNKTGLSADEHVTKPAFKFSENPLMRSGLVFSGANHAWEGEEIPFDLDDGILTAYEVSNMYIPNTGLVVLSACETGLGEIRGSEGVFGLQRSFKIAGADYILMSLWQIPDYQTSELMNHIYTEWFSGKSIQEAFRMAQYLMKNKYPFQPFMWAGFVLVR